jgi:DNA-binding LacI/PurR family transcriptional regulator
VKAETRAKVEAAMAEPDYRPNATARALRKGRTGVVGLAVSNINMTYSAELARAVMEEAAKHGCRVAVEETRGRPEAETEAWLRSPLVGFDNIQPASYAVPSLTTIDPHVGELVETAVGMLLERMRGFDGAGRLHVGRCVLVRRESTAL